MNRLFAAIAGFVTRRPVAALALLGVVTAVLLGGMALRVNQAGNDVFLPEDSKVRPGLGHAVGVIP